MTLRGPTVEGRTGLAGQDQLQKKKEQYLVHFDTDVEEVEIEANLSYFISGKKGDVIYTVKEKMSYEVD